MRVLFVHQNFPAQYLHLAPALARAGHEVTALMQAKTARDLPGVRGLRYALTPPSPTGKPSLDEWQTKVARGSAVARAATQLRQQGYQPDVICVHPGWGESLFLRDVWPQARQLHFVEWYYGWDGHDVTFDPEFRPADEGARWRARLKNTHLLHALVDMDAGVCPTRWQHGTLPELVRPRVSVVHDGIDTAAACPAAGAVFSATDRRGTALRLTEDDRVISFVNRNLEPARGFHVFMRALPRLLDADRRARVVIVGGDDVSYGGRARGGRSWRETLLQELGDRWTPDIDARVHFVGRIPHAELMNLFRVSRAHVYLTYPFVLSWSMLEAMACGACVVGSRTAPVTEVISHGVNGWLVDFFDTDALCERLRIALALTPEERHALSEGARTTIVQRYDLRTRCLPDQIRLVTALGGTA